MKQINLIVTQYFGIRDLCKTEFEHFPDEKEFLISGDYLENVLNDFENHCLKLGSPALPEQIEFLKDYISQYAYNIVEEFIGMNQEDKNKFN